MDESNIDSLNPYELLLTPVYVQLKKNQKLLAIKSSIELLMPDEIEKFKVFKKIFIPAQAVSELQRYKKLAEIIYSILNTQETVSVGVLSVNMDMHPSETGAYVRNELQDFFRATNSITPEGIITVVNLLLGPIDHIEILETYSKSINEFKTKYIYSSIKTLEHLIYGYGNIPFLKKTRRKWINESIIRTEESNQALFNSIVTRVNEWGGTT